MTVWTYESHNNEENKQANYIYFFCVGGRGALRLQVCVRARGAHLPGLPWQSAAQPEGRVWALCQRGGHGAPVTPGWGSALHPWTRPSKHGPSALLQRLHVLKPAPTFRNPPVVPAHHHTHPETPTHLLHMPTPSTCIYKATVLLF